MASAFELRSTLRGAGVPTAHPTQHGRLTAPAHRGSRRARPHHLAAREVVDLAEDQLAVGADARTAAQTATSYGSRGGAPNARGALEYLFGDCLSPNSVASEAMRRATPKPRYSAAAPAAPSRNRRAHSSSDNTNHSSSQGKAGAARTLRSGHGRVRAAQ